MSSIFFKQSLGRSTSVVQRKIRLGPFITKQNVYDISLSLYQLDTARDLTSILNLVLKNF